MIWGNIHYGFIGIHVGFLEEDSALILEKL